MLRRSQFTISPAALAEVIDDSGVYKVLASELEASKLLRNLLTYFCQDVRESLVDSSLKVQWITFELNGNTASGEFEIDFQGDVYMGCRDMNHTSERNEVLPIQIDLRSGIAVVEVDIPEPSPPDDEF